MIEVTSLTKVYGTGDGAVTAVDDVSLSVPAGQVFGILGRSGAGKTTLMRCLTALERPTSGSVTIGELNLTELTASGLPGVWRLASADGRASSASGVARARINRLWGSFMSALASRLSRPRSRTLG